jgi:hypothetical protein
MTDETHGFDTDILDLLAREKEVEIETWSPDGRARRTIIWLVVAAIAAAGIASCASSRTAPSTSPAGASRSGRSRPTTRP